MPYPTFEQKLEKKIISRFQKAIYQYNLIQDGDNILIALSGGKDSLCMLEMLGRRMKIHNPYFKAEAVHIRMDNVNYQSDTSYLKSFADGYGIPLHVIATHFDFSENSGKPICFLCSWYRRKQIFNLAQKLGCNKIALGHHMDDIIHTAMMNQFFQGQFSTMPVKLQMKKIPLAIIRPLCLVSETDISQYAEMKGYEKQKKLCPFEKESHRTNMRDIFNTIEKINPEARYSMWNALEAAGKLIEL
ncbi:tRNA 2-thiocytidine biosynthesis TtcA family protein [Xylanibacter muris]|uniref:tRNA 2-thiocytidine biosynthesis protein TtcA n=1 Tax=Xylanibacter muris TaxID=2736290 RepID=A0ABX2ASC7_9BACT|nr:tRNA 2-thiocytidine biosynthesis TtcA family protein [Xylanibacter muris]NPD93115.1 tRNA 2-thiocytidine biosynthesis protein TtcA [Xylanibacter muris]